MVSIFTSIPIDLEFADIKKPSKMIEFHGVFTFALSCALLAVMLSVFFYKHMFMFFINVAAIVSPLSMRVSWIVIQILEQEIIIQLDLKREI